MLLQKLYHANSGTISIDGTDIEELEVDHLRSQIAVVDQEPRLFNTTLKQNIAYGVGSEAAPSDDRVESAAKMASVDEFIPNLAQGYDTHVGELGGRLSGGQRQRVAIARALVRHERIKVRSCGEAGIDV
jgi:ABC-type multidrug transport system fused ATPase/permease subunit